MTQTKTYSATYRIRRISDGLYSLGGSRPRWNKKGKTWVDLHCLKKHLSLVRYPINPSNPYNDCDNFEIVCDYYVTVRTEGHCESLREIKI